MTAGTKAGDIPTGLSFPTGANTVKSSATNPAAAAGGPEPTDANTNTKSSEPPIGVIVGGAIGGVAVIAGIILAIFFIRKRNRTSSGSAGAALLPDGHMDYENNARITPFQYPIPQSTGTPPLPQMQQYNMSPYGTNQIDAASSHNHLPQSQQQYNLHPDTVTKQRPIQGGFVGGIVMPDSHGNTSNYAPSSYTASSDAPYQSALSPGGASSTVDSNILLSPSISSHSSAPLISPQQQSSSSKYSQSQDPAAAAAPFDSPPAYDDAPTVQDDVPAQASSSGAQPLSAAEIELISQRVASLVNHGAGPPKKN